MLSLIEFELRQQPRRTGLLANLSERQQEPEIILHNDVGAPSEEGLHEIRVHECKGSPQSALPDFKLKLYRETVDFVLTSVDSNGRLRRAPRLLLRDFSSISLC